MAGDSPDENNAKYSEKPVTGDWVVLNLLGEPESLNPYTSSSASASNIFGLLYESFITTRREPPYDEVPLLVESLPEISDDHLIYKWKLKTTPRWHDGKPLTMQDALFSLKAIMNPFVDNLPSKPYYAELDSVILTDSLTMVMYCSQPYFLHLGFLGGFEVLPKHIFDPDGLMDGLTYFQVKNGTVFGTMSDYLKKGETVSFANLIQSSALFRLSNSLDSYSDEEIKWDDVESAIPNYKKLTVNERYTAVTGFLKEHPKGETGLRFLSETITEFTRGLNTLPEWNVISKLKGDISAEDRDKIQTVCQDINDRISRFGEQFNTHPQGREPTVASGPYKFEKWKTGTEIILNRNTDYWRGEGHAYLDKLVWRVLTDYTASLVALKNGEIDYMEEMQTIQYLTMTNQKKFLDQFVKSRYLIPSYSYIGWRNGHPIFKDVRVRQAMTLMVRRHEIAEKMLFGFAEVVNSNFYRYGIDYDSTIIGAKFNPDSAVALLRDAGWEDRDGDGILEKDGLKFKFELLLPSSSQTAMNLASILREDLYMIGVEMDIRSLEWSVFINNYIREHNFDACYLGWVFGMKGDPKQVWHSESASGRGSNHVEFRNPEADAIIDSARVEFDQDKRVAMYHRFQQILHREQPYTFLFSSMVKPAYSKRFKGVTWYPFRPGYQLDEWFVPKEEQKFR